MTHKNYFPGLNGLRAISAMAVVISHITLNLGNFNLSPYIFGTLKHGGPRGLMLGNYGVTIFFVLSGFLITFLLQAEKDIAVISIKKFYLRRILRIWPLYYLYFTIAVITLIILGFELDSKSLLLFIFLAPNVPYILGIKIQLLAHFWSLGVEEQFYFFWPWINKKARFLTSIIILFIIILVGVKIVCHLFFPGSLLETAITITRFHCMLVGGLGALWYKNNHHLFLSIADNKLTQFICWGIIGLAAINKFHIASVIDDELIAVVALFLIVGQVRIKNRIINLDLPVFNFIGKISYGIYVIHPLLIFFFYKLLADVMIDMPFNYVIIYFLILSTTILLSYLSYISFEKYFLKLKEKFA